jgi:UrcA family protein
MMLFGAHVSAAYAQGDAPTIAVRYANRDVASEAGAQRLLQRIEGAAHEICRDQNLEPLALHAAARRCYFAAIAHAVDAVNAPRVRAAYVAKYGAMAPAAEAKASQAPAVRHSRQG